MPKVSEEYYTQKRNEIIDSAYKIALEKPISNMTLMDVRERAGMARGAIYRYYDSLDQILADLIKRINEDNSYVEDVKKIFDTSKNSSPKMTFKRLADFLFEYITSREMDVFSLEIQFDILCITEPERVKNIMALAGEQGNESVAYLINSLAEYIEAEKKKKTIKPVLKTADLINYLMTVYKGIALQYSIEKSMDPSTDYNLKESITAFYKTCLAMVGYNETRKKNEQN